MRHQSDRLFYALVGASLIPMGAIVFALARAAQDIRAALTGAPSPISGLCRQAVVYTLDPFAHVADVGFAAAAVIAITLGMVAGLATHFRTRRALRGHLLDAPIPERLKRLAGAAGIRRIHVIASSKPLAFTFGYFTPCVAVSDTCQEQHRAVRCFVDPDWRGDGNWTLITGGISTPVVRWARTGWFWMRRRG